MRRLRLVLICLICLISLSGVQAAPAELVRVGVLSFRSLEQTQARWAPTIARLQRAIPGYRFELRPLFYPDLEEAVRKHELEFIFTNPEHYVLLRSRYGPAAMVTLMPLVEGRPVNQFGGVIFTRADRQDIRTLGDLKGKVIASPLEQSLGGYLMQRWALRKAGIGLADLASMRFTGMPHDKVVEQVIAGEAEAGFVRTGVLEAMGREGALDMARVKVLNPQTEAGFPQHLSTELYPEWPFSAMRGVPEPLVKKVTLALLAIEPGSPPARAGHYFGFSPPGDYSPIEALMLRLNVHPDHQADFNLRDIFAKYALWIIGVLGLFLLVLLWVVYRLKRDKRRANEAEERIRTLAFFDPLTRLPNRRLLLDRLKHALAACQRSRHHGALLFIDLDDFKSLNDTLGHDQGDRFLHEVGQRLTECVRKGDTVARLGGDEFVVMLENLSDKEAVAAEMAKGVGDKIQVRTRQPYLLSGHERYITSSIGVALFSCQDGNVDDLLKRADMAMYQAKSSGRNALFFFDPAMQAAVEARIALENELRLAIKNEAFVLHYQLQVDREERPIGVEALLRWQHPQRGLLPCEAFIDVAEECGLATGLGQRALETACRQLNAWHQQPGLEALSLSVNISARQFRHPDFVASVEHALETYCPKKGKLTLELKESTLLQAVDEAIDKMRRLEAKGVRFTLDNFGMGYASLANLKRLPLHELKIDVSLVKNVLDDPNDAAIVQTMIALGSTLGLSVMAEGVETPDQKAYLVEHGCQAFQGYLFGAPMSADALAARLPPGA